MSKTRTVSRCALIIASLGCAPLVPAAAFLPDFGAAAFVPGAAVDHAWFPLLDGLTRIYEGYKENDEGELVLERFELTVVGSGPTILGVQSTSRRDRAYEEGLLVEDTFDYFAQDTSGNVWYLGEDVTNYHYDDEDNLIGTDSASAWRAGVNGALPGFIMPADLSVGFNYYQEFAAADNALDQGTTFITGEMVSLGIDNFANVLRVLETNELKPDDREFKYYAPGLGLILVEEGLDLNLENPEARIELVATVPLPPAWPLLGFGAAALARRRRRR